MALAFKCVVIVAAITSAISLEPVEEGLDWDDFESALREDGAEDVISLLQTQVSVKRKFVDRKLVDTSQDSLKSKDSHAETLDGMGDLSPNSFADALMSEETPPEAVSLVQTDAHIERKSTPSKADQKPNTQDGMMHISVAADGSIHSEDSLFLFQTDAQTNRVTVVTEADGTNVVASSPKSKEHIFATDLDELHGEDANAGISLLQVDFQAPSDTTLVGVDQPTVSVSDATVEDETSLQQVEVTPTRVRIPTAAHKLADNGFDTIMDVSADGEKSPDALSLLQTEAHIESKHTAMITEADGSNVEFNSEMHTPHQSSNGMMHVSVSADGRFHWEI